MNRDYEALIKAGTAATMEKLLENHHKPGFDSLDVYEEFKEIDIESDELYAELYTEKGLRIPVESLDYRKIRREAADVIARAMMLVKACDDKLEESGE